MHTHLHIKESSFCLVALTKSQKLLRRENFAFLTVFKSRWFKSISAVPPLRAESISGGEFSLCKLQSTAPSQFAPPQTGWFFGFFSI